MNDNINWKDSYLELEEQMLEMTKMFAVMLDKEVQNATPAIHKVHINSLDDTLEIIAISKANKPQFLFEVLNEKEKVLSRKYTGYKNSYKLNTLLYKKKIKVKISIRNENSDSFVDFYTTGILNEESAL
ncbi:hypothetical protein [Macrococcoides canis]|uniref:hypothetical protein n=1 Tax=Macrococcoides canis TaxID=1855823 RepID=UPI00165D4FDC|nr:hypothetical protein [Macrococcus canis]QNR07498.1 hypothetical protein GL258_04270 [Macrococcus canis]QTQ08951.1 hypothetical protein J9174_04580 [Macrococcus canis]